MDPRVGTRTRPTQPGDDISMTQQGPGGPARPAPSSESPGDPAPPEDVIRQFVEHWGVMARSWGINATMGELFALLYITGTDWTAEGLRAWLRVSRGNVSMN